MSGDETFLEKDRERIRKYRSENPSKYKAHCAVNNALRDGKITKPTCCEHCGKELPLQGHHSSYDKEHWLDIIWLCTSCHSKEHKRLQEIARSSVEQ